MGIFYIGIAMLITGLTLLAIQSPFLFIAGLLAIAFLSVTK